ncbi:MAG: sigma-70 family RNA polymerase sigma factor [Bacteroidales bacterium]|nr:sigma-70 family RNA polymerase sigma factor [Bacteroidales bacterium]
MSNSYTDFEIYNRLLRNDERMIRYVFYEHFNSMLRFNALKAAGNKSIELDDLIQELYLYISKNDWEKLRKYSPEYPFANWFSVVSYRFFKDFTFSMIESSQNVPIDNIDDRTVLSQGNNISSSIIMDIKNAIRKAKPPRDRQILEALILNEEEPTDVAAQFEVTVDNLYNIKRRAIAKLIKNHLQDYLNR